MEIACVCHDGDKLASLSRIGILEVREFTGRLTSTATSSSFGSAQPMVEPQEIPTLFGVNVRLYCSSIYFHTNMLVSDGFDNKVLLLKLGDENLDVARRGLAALQSGNS